jgi:hypothetical protein
MADSCSGELHGSLPCGLDFVASSALARELSSGYQRVNLRANRCRFRSGAKIIVDHNPTTVGEQTP